MATPSWAEPVQAPLGPSGSWNVYELIDQPVTWQQAWEEVAANEFAGVRGQLVDIVSPAENAFVEWLAAGDPVWIGLTDREGAAPIRDHGGVLAPQESSKLSDPAKLGWAWTSGADFNFQNWEPGEPLDYRQSEDAVLLKTNGRWDDLASGFGPNEPLAPSSQPNTSTDELRALAFPYVVEYPVASPAALPGVAILPVPPRMPEPLPAAASLQPLLRVTDVRGDFTLSERVQEVSDLLTQIAREEIAVDRWTADYAWADVADPDGGNSGGPSVDGVPFSFPSNQPQQLDENFISMARGTILVPETATYTIQVRSSSGFALQIGDQSFRAVHGMGQLDATDDRTLYHSLRYGDSNTRGVIELSAGEHDVRFVAWSVYGPAFWEISTAQGEHLQDVTAQWLALGDARILPPRQLQGAVDLVGAATVVNARGLDFSPEPTLAAAAAQLATSLADGTALRRDDVTTLILRDEDGICCERPGATLDASQTFLWPVNDPAVGGGQQMEDYFASTIAGQLVVDDGDQIPGETVPITFGIFASDGAQLHLHGASFLQTNGGEELLGPVDGDQTLRFPWNSGNTNTLGLIELTEGQVYDFDVLHFDARGDAGFELWAAVGEHLDGFDYRLFFPVSSVLDGWTLPENQGLAFVTPHSQSLPPGDFNGDQQLDVQDLNQLIFAIGSTDAPFDLNSDAVVDWADLEVWIHDLRHTWIGDANFDGLFDSNDLIQVITAGRFESERPADWQTGDWNADGFFSSQDLVLALQDGGYEAGLWTGGQPVPETNLVLPWLLGCGLRRRCRRREPHHDVR